MKHPRHFIFLMLIAALFSTSVQTARAEPPPTPTPSLDGLIDALGMFANFYFAGAVQYCTDRGKSGGGNTGGGGNNGGGTNNNGGGAHNDGIYHMDGNGGMYDPMQDCTDGEDSRGGK